MPAILFGSISTVADTSELQRRAFNQAFADHGLDWRWDQGEYKLMLTGSGGAARIAEFARSRGQDVDAQAVHQTKSAIFQASLAGAGLQPRAGVVDTIRQAKKAGWNVALVTTTSRENISALLQALEPEVQADSFDLIVDVTDVEQPKPDPEAYAFALQRLDQSADSSVAIEDNAGGVQAALAAGLACVAFPNENTAANDLPAGAPRVDRLDADQLQQLAHRQ